MNHEDPIAAGLAAGAECLEAALSYLQRGWSVLALCPPDHVGVARVGHKDCGSPGKRPWHLWTEYQDRPPAEAEVREWWRVLPNSNVGVALGPVSGLVRVDVEGAAGEAALVAKAAGDLPPTLEFKSGRGDGTGRGLLYAVPAGVTLRTTAESYGAKQELRFQARGAQTALPPSRHPDGGRYAWLPGRGPGAIDPAPAPAWLVAELAERRATPRDGAAAGGGPIPEGRRDDTLTSLAGAMRRKGMTEDEILAALLAVNGRCAPPLPEDQVRKIARSVAGYAPDGLAGVKIKGAGAGASGNGNGHAGNGQAEEPWEEPVPFGDEPPAPFPLWALPDPLHDMACAVAEAMPCPPDMPACTALAACAAAIGNTRQLRLKSSWHERARLWVAVVCKAGSKKSPAAAAVLGPVRDGQRRLREDYRRERARYEEDLAAWEAQGGGGQKPRPPAEHQLYTVDATREALADLLAFNSRGLLMHRDELAGWVRGLNQYKPNGKGDDRQFWLSLWSGEDVVVNRRGRAVFAEDPFVCVAGNVPPGVLSVLNDEQGREDGFIHRILFSWPAPVKPGWTDREPPAAVLGAYQEFFGRLSGLSFKDDLGRPGPHTLSLLPAAKELFVGFVNGLADDLADEDFADQLRGPWSKLEGYCARLALVVHTARVVAGEASTHDVDEASMGGAVALARYFQAHARRVYPRLLAFAAEKVQQDAGAVLAWVRRNRHKIEPATPSKPAGAFSWRTLRMDLHNRFGDSEDALRKALQALEARGFIREVPRNRQGFSGRLPCPDYFVNPCAWYQNQQNQRNGAGTCSG